MSQRKRCMCQGGGERKKARSAGAVLSDLREVEEELEDAGAEVVYDEWGSPTGLDLDGAEGDVDELKVRYKTLLEEKSQLLDLVKQGKMKWVKGSEQEHLKLELVSDYYYYVYEECNEVMEKGWWEFKAALSESEQKHFDRYLHDYFYYGYPVYQTPDNEEYTDGDLAFENGVHGLYTSTEMREKAIETLKKGETYVQEALIELYNEDVHHEEGIQALQEILGKPIVPSKGEYFKTKCKLAYCIKKHHVY